MKIRIRDNSVRLRRARGEIDVMRENGVVMSLTHFPGGKEFRYSLESSPTTVRR
ncbi:MAG: hypothetical protein IIB75_03135 [Proteobacteria bacterium]|nr:hypothetical protein [Pseudomonadota bacterium]